MIKLSLIKQILNVNDHIIATYPPKLMISGFFEVINVILRPLLLLCFSSIVNDENNFCQAPGPGPGHALVKVHVKV